jgi:hypothetical protein
VARGLLCVAIEAGGWMTFRLERCSNGGRCVLRLIGNVRSGDLEEIGRELDACGPGATLDLEEVAVVSVEVIRFLAERERRGCTLSGCPAYVREWISREAERHE